MFTGIIEGLGTITSLHAREGGRRLRVACGFSLDETKVGDSIAVNGACLTVIETDGRRFAADLSPETVARTTFNDAKTGQPVNIERAMRLSDRLDGHIVSGHIDGIGTIRSIEKIGNAIIVTISVSEELGKYMIPKGSVAVDGISLTINTCSGEQFTVSIIPHTAKITTIGSYRLNTRVNIETDIIGKYVANFIDAAKPVGNATGQTNKRLTAPVVDKALLDSTGFLLKSQTKTKY